MMKLAYVLCIAVGLGVGVTHAAGTDCQATSSKMLDHLDQGDYVGATADFDGRMKTALSADKLGTLWQAMPKQLGTRGAREPARPSQVQGYAVVVTPLHYGQGMVDAQVACDADGKVGGFYIKPHQ